MGNKILLIDDSVTVQKIITLTFSDEGVDVVTLDNGEDAINRLQYLRPALVMADVSIPGKNGYDVCEYIKGNPELSKIPVILLVPGFESYDEQRARRAGADHHLTKPFQSIRSLIATVKNLIEGREPDSPRQSGSLLDIAEPQSTGELAMRSGVEEEILEFDELFEQPPSRPFATRSTGGLDTRSGKLSPPVATSAPPVVLPVPPPEVRVIQPEPVVVPEPVVAQETGHVTAPTDSTASQLPQSVIDEIVERVSARVIEALAERISREVTERLTASIESLASRPVVAQSAHLAVYHDPEPLLELD